MSMGLDPAEDLSETVWLGWHCVLGAEPCRAQQLDFILDFIGPTVERLGDKVSLFHFFRYFRAIDSLDWSVSNLSRVRNHVNGADQVCYVTFRCRSPNIELADQIEAEVVEAAKGFPHALLIPEPREVGSVRKGLDTYGGDEVHPLQHEFFDRISRTSLGLLALDRAGRLAVPSDGYGTEHIAPQWTHMLLNQLGVVEQPAQGVEGPDGQTAFYLAAISR